MEQTDIIRRQIEDIEVRSINEEARTFEVIASTASLDSHGDVVEQTFDLKRYKKNPVVLWAHNAFGMFDGSRPEDFLPIGKASDVRIANGQLEAKIHLIQGTATEEPLVDKIWRRVLQKSLRAVSIGFRPGTVEQRKDDLGHTYFVLSDNELFEISMVPIPSNPDAVAKAIHNQRKVIQLRAKSFETPSPRMVQELPTGSIDELIVECGGVAHASSFVPLANKLRDLGDPSDEQRAFVAEQRLSDPEFHALQASRTEGSESLVSECRSGAAKLTEEAW